MTKLILLMICSVLPLHSMSGTQTISVDDRYVTAISVVQNDDEIEGFIRKRSEDDGAELSIEVSERIDILLGGAFLQEITRLIHSPYHNASTISNDSLDKLKFQLYKQRLRDNRENKGYTIPQLKQFSTTQTPNFKLYFSRIETLPNNAGSFIVADGQEHLNFNGRIVSNCGFQMLFVYDRERNLIEYKKAEYIE